MPALTAPPAVFGIVPFALLLGWVPSVTAGHTKRASLLSVFSARPSVTVRDARCSPAGTTTNATVLVGYALGNAVGPFMWKKRYQPRNRVPWAVIAACSLASAALLLLARAVLARENRARERERAAHRAEGDEDGDGFDEVYVAQADADGKTVERRVDRAFLDLTDRQNRQFRYVL